MVLPIKLDRGMTINPDDLPALEALCVFGIERGIIKLERRPPREPGMDNRVYLKIKWLGCWITLCWLYEDPYTDEYGKPASGQRTTTPKIKWSP